MALNTERLIAEVRSRPSLWDLRTPAYKNRDAKQNAWVEVARAMYEDFDNSTQDEKERAVKSVLQRWKSARDQYVRLKTQTLKEGSEEKSKIKYIFANEMSFLNPVINMHRIFQSSQIGDNKIAQSDHTKTEEVQTIATTSQKPTSPPREPEAIPTKRRKINDEGITRFEKKLLDVLQRCNGDPSSDDDVAFFNSLLPTVRLLDLQQKLQFRIQILQLLTSYARHLQQPPSVLNRVPSENQSAPSITNSGLLKIPAEFQSVLDASQNIKQEACRNQWPINSMPSPTCISPYDSTSSNDESCSHGGSQQLKEEKEEGNDCSEIEEHFEFDFKKL